jgi:hypothetical protein
MRAERAALREALLDRLVAAFRESSLRSTWSKKDQTETRQEFN